MTNRAYFPAKNDPWLLRILSRLNLDTGLVSNRLQVTPVPNAEVDNCFFNVRNYVNSNGGEIVFGWALWKLEPFFVEAEHHAVFRAVYSTELLDITPSADSDIKYRSFIIDQNSKYDFNDDKKRLNNIRVPIYDHPSFYRLIELHKKKNKILDKYPIGENHLNDDDSKKYRKIELEIARFEQECFQIAHSNIAAKVTF